MATAQQYEAYKQYLKSLNLTPAEYKKRLDKWCKKVGY
jgi:flagellar biosynthesis chaperone FliJ